MTNLGKGAAVPLNKTQEETLNKHASIVDPTRNFAPSALERFLLSVQVASGAVVQVRDPATGEIVFESNLHTPTFEGKEVRKSSEENAFDELIAVIHILAMV